MPDRKLDAPDGVAFAKEIVKNIPDGKEHKRMMLEIGGAYILGKVYKGAIRRK
jgi:hypothetical protein